MDVPITQTYLNGGMIRDAIPSFQPNNSWRLLRNGKTKSRSNKNFGITNDEANKKVDSILGIVGATYVDHMNATIVFSSEDSGSIYLIDHNKDFALSLVAKASEFGCDWNTDKCDCHWINPQFKVMQPCDETHVYWSNGEDYFTVNIAEMLDPVRKSALIECITKGEDNSVTCGYSCEHFRLMKCVCGPNTKTIPLEGGGQIPNGIYQFVVQLEDNAGNTTNWFDATNKVNIGSEDNISGIHSQKSIDVHIYNLSCKYDKVRIAVIKNGLNAEVVAERHYTNQAVTYNYTGEEGVAIDFNEIQIKKRAYIKGKELTQKDGRLWLYKVQPEVNPNLQARIYDEVNFKFKEYIRNARTVEKYGMMTLERDEGYIFAVVYNMCDGTHSPAFLLSPSGGGSSTTQEDTGTNTGQQEEDGENDGDTGGRSSPPELTDTPASASESGVLVEPTATTTGKFIRRRKKTGIIGPCLEGEDCNQDETFPQIDDTETTASESGVAGAIETWVTEIPNIVIAAHENDCDEFDGGCCDGSQVFTPAANANLGTDKCLAKEEDQKAIAADLPKIQTISTRHVDDLAHMLEAGDEQTKDTTDFTSSTWKTAASRLTDAIDNMEQFEQTKQKSNIDINLRGAESQSSGDSNSLDPETNDPYTIGGETEIENNHGVGKTYDPRIRYSTEIYPDTKDCQGNFLHGTKANQPIEISVTPRPDESQIITAKTSGVPGPESPNVDTIYNTDIKLLGLDVTGVPTFTKEEAIEVFGKPLCPRQPYRIVQVPRDYSNSTVQAKGVFTHTFLGTANGKDFVYPKHGLNGPELYDRFIDDSGSRAGRINPEGIYNFHSLTANTNQVPLTGNTVRVYGSWLGQGYRYGLYEKGIDPELPITGRRIDQRGARQYINANSFSPRFEEHTIEGLTYAPANTVVPIPGTGLELSNRYRESSVAMKVDSLFSGSQEDKSFIADGYNHSAPIKNAHTWYGAIIKERPDQYGSVVGMRFVDTGIVATGNTGNVNGICGDVYIGPHTFKRTGYVSDKVGNSYPTPERDRTVCDSPNMSATQSLGLDHNPLELPNDSDITDAKNWANAYSDTGVPLTWSQAADAGFTGVDIYYPKVQKTLITTWSEDKVSGWLRETGIGPAKVHGQVYYPKIKELNLDSNDHSKHAWEDSYINRFYYEIIQPSKAQLIRKALIKNLIEYITPFIGIEMILENMDTATTTVASLALLPILVAYWYFTEQVATNDQYLNSMLGLPKCSTDDTGGETDNNIRNFEDNYYEYNNFYSRPNYFNLYQSMPEQYNTCDCRDGCKSWTNEIFFSSKQSQGSQVDHYKNFKALNYTEIPAEKGKITKLFPWNGSLYFHTTDGLGIMKYGPITTQTNLGLVLLGGNDLVFDPFTLMDGVGEGFAGLQSTNASSLTKFGYFFVDEEARKIYRYAGSGLPIEISNYENSGWFKKNLTYCDKQECHDAKRSDGSGMHISFDPRYDIIYFTKQDGPEGNSFTISFDPEKQQGNWVSFHDFIPRSSFNDRYDSFTIKDDSYYQHNIEGKYLTYYDEEVPFEVGVSLTTPLVDTTFTDAKVRLHTRKGDIVNTDRFFDVVAIWNSTQGTGTVVLELQGDNRGDRENRYEEILEDPQRIRVTKIDKNNYQFNAVHDNTVSECENKAMTIQDSCSVYEKVNEEIFDCDASNDETFGNRILVDDHIEMRFSVYDTETEFKLISVQQNVGQDNK
jgi:hypothetical protein